MLYATTRNNLDTFTVNHILQGNNAPDGGRYLPFRHPEFSAQEVAALKDQSFNAAMAKVLNVLFGTALTSWDLDFSVGRYPVRLQELGGRVLIGETWHNPDWHFAAMTHRIGKLLGAQSAQGWVEIAVRAAALFGIYGELLRQGCMEPGECIDVSVLSGSFSGPVSVYYAKKWGLPVQNIVCCCNENNELWNLICHGQFHTDSLAKNTCIPEADVAIPEELERLVLDCGGREEVEDYLECCRRGSSYFPGESCLANMRRDLFVSVVSSQRIRQTIPGVYATHRYLMGPGTALAYAGLLDYRAKKGPRRIALILSERSPVCDIGLTAEILNVTEAKVKELL